MALSRIGFLVRIDSMVNVGCKFAPDDLPFSVWDELVMFAQERNRIDELIREQRDKGRDKTDAGEREKLDAARREGNVPPPGTSIFR